MLLHIQTRTEYERMSKDELERKRVPLYKRSEKKKSQKTIKLFNIQLIKVFKNEKVHLDLKT